MSTRNLRAGEGKVTRYFSVLVALLLTTFVFQADAADELCVSRYAAGYMITQTTVAEIISKSADICTYSAQRKQEAEAWISRTLKRYEHRARLITRIKVAKSYMETRIPTFLKASIDEKGAEATCAEIRKEIDKIPQSDFR